MSCRFKFCLGILLVLPALTAQDVVQTSFDADSLTWSLSNSLISVQYRLDENGRLRLWDLRRAGGTAWVAGGAPFSSPIYIALDSGSDPGWILSGTSQEPAAAGGRRLVVDLVDAHGPTEVTLAIEMYPNQPFVRTSYTYRNLDQVSHTVGDLRYTNLWLQPSQSPVRALYVNQVRQSTPLMFDINETVLDPASAGISVQGGAYGDNCTWLALRDGRDQGVISGWEFDGRGYLNAQMDPGSGAVALFGAPLALHAPVAPGETLAGPASFIGLFSGDWDEAAYRTHRFVEAVLATPRPDDQFPYFAFDTWGYGQDLDETTLRRAADIAAQTGVELFIVDLGWARRIGDWQVDPIKFPGGMRALSDYVHSLGMKFGLHFVPAEAAPDSPMLQDNPDWTSSISDGYFGAQSLCLSHAPVQNNVLQQLFQFINLYQPDWITQDGENLVKNCTKPGHTHDPANSNWSNAVSGIDALVSATRTAYPNIQWENNADGGTMSTFAAVGRYATFASCDGCDVLPRRQAVYGMSYVFPPRFMDRYMPEPPTAFTTRSSMFGGPWILMQRITDWKPEQISLVRAEAALYKSLRGVINDGKVFHLTGRPDGYSIEAMESFHPDQNRGVVFVYRSDTSSSEIVIYPRGLRPDGHYHVSFQDNRLLMDKSGVDLMSDGIRVALPEKNFAEIVYLVGY